MRIKLFLIIALTLCLMPGLATAHPQNKHVKSRDQWTIIHAGTLLDVPGQPAKTEQSIIVKNGNIESVHSGYTPVGDVGDGTASFIDLSGKFVLPGLIDSHVHLGLGGDFSKGRTAKTGKDTFRLLDVAENAQKTLYAGYTTVRNVGSFDWAVFAMRDGVNKGVMTGPRIFSAGHTIEISAAEDQGTGKCYSVASCRRAVLKQYAMGADLIKVYATCSGSKPCGWQHASPVFSDEELKAVIDTAKARGLKVAAHGHAKAGINQALRLGVASIEHGSYNDRISHQLFKKNGAFLVPTLAVEDNVIRDHKTATSPMKKVMADFIDQHPKRFLAAYKAGVKIAAGSDAGVIPHGENANELVWYVKTGMPASEAIKAATVNAATLLGQDEKFGTIEAGKYADIIAVTGNPLDDIERLKAVNFVMQNGQVIKSD